MPTHSPDPTWLSLLLDGASGADLDVHRSAQLGTVGGAERETVEAEAARARRVQELLVERSRQASELAVLNDLARSLSSLREPHEVLQQVAREARRFLAVDIAYVMLLDDHQELTIEVVDGSIGSVLRGVRLGRGVGLAGQVLAQGTPMWTEDYLDDPRLEHTGDVDTAAAAEQISGILAVPLLVEGATIGILCAADRRPRAFSDHEVELLAALGSHAAVAIHNATLFDRAQATADELRRRGETTQRAVEVHHRLMETVIRGGGVSDVVDALQDVLDVDVTLLDAQDRRLAASSDDPSPHLRELLDNATGTQVFGGGDVPGTRIGRVGDGHAAVIPLRLRHEYGGCVLAMSANPLSDDAVRLVENGATVVALALASERAVAEAERRVRGELVGAVVTGSADDEHLRRRAHGAGLDLQAIRAVMVLEPEGDHAAAQRVVDRLAEDQRGWSAEHAGQFVVLVPDSSAETVRNRLIGFDDGRLPGVAGVASTDGGVHGIRAAHQEAQRCTAVLLALGRRSVAAVPAELGVFRTLFGRAGRDDIVTFVASTLGPLQAHDAEQGTDLVQTLATYLELARHHAETAKALHVHVNTLYARLNRITEVLGDSWRDPDHSLDLHLAVRLQRLDETLSAR